MKNFNTKILTLSLSVLTSSTCTFSMEAEKRCNLTQQGILESKNAITGRMLFPVSEEAIKSIEKNIKTNPKDLHPFFWFPSVTQLINPYYSSKYLTHDNSVTDKTFGTNITVNRSNHGLAHGWRQGFLVFDIIAILNMEKNAQLCGDKSLGSWVQNALKKDPLFKYKMQFAATFMRIGRESEVGSDHPDYQKQKIADVQIFWNVAKHLIGSLFKDKGEPMSFAKAICGKYQSAKLTDDEYMMKRIFDAAHSLDLRRLFVNKEQDTKYYYPESIAYSLYGEQNKNNHHALKIVDKLYDRAALYLQATGDERFLKNYFVKKFFTQSKEPEQMTKALLEASKKEI